jgi:hypothetical protein
MLPHHTNGASESWLETSGPCLQRLGEGLAIEPRVQVLALIWDGSAGHEDASGSPAMDRSLL